ncbi:MAG: hypothetical protein ACI8Q1_000229 [Parvicella sp.]|jgi:hypothetical protein
MKKCIIKREYRSKANTKEDKSLYLYDFHVGASIRGDWTENESEAHMFWSKKDAREICKGLLIDGLSLIEK